MLPRIFIEPVRILEHTAYIADREKVHRVRNVLRLQEGDRLIVLDNTGTEYLCRIQEPAQKRIKMEIEEERDRKQEGDIDLHLYPALIKKNRFETILEKCTEIGVTSFSPMITERTETRITEVPERWRKIVREAAEQSERVSLPEIEKIVTFGKALDRVKEGEGFILQPGEVNTPDFDSLKKEKNKLHVFIGPEGGFTDSELEEAGRKKFNLVSLGGRPLRTETAAIAISSLFVYTF